jgi:hypothetical protein
MRDSGLKENKCFISIISNRIVFEKRIPNEWIDRLDSLIMLSMKRKRREERRMREKR